MFSTYKPEDVVILLKDITGMVEPLGTKEREAYIQSGVHYSEMLPIEYVPTQPYLDTYQKALSLYAPMTADAVASLAEKIWEDKGPAAVLVSLARAGTPIGILLKRYIAKRYGVQVAHYTISIIRGKGIDRRAMDYILSRHAATDLQFVDGWTGKGAIQNELNRAMADYPGVHPGLAVLSDPAYVAEKCGTHDDFFIASSCLNSTVSGLLSRTFHRPDLITDADFHGAAFYRELTADDRTYEFIETIERHFPAIAPIIHEESDGDGMDEVKKICREFGIADIHLVKPSIGEATRVLLRRLPWKVLVHSLTDEEHLGHLYRLAEEKQVEVVEYPLRHYRACGIIRSLADT